ncbi:MAG: hypothetical protein HC814_06805, partial [Rhodobacteraceae bacterium]|nr:hypothetical protein [Paracoccaceae bacterium]
SALHFGLGRMFSAFMENFGLRIEVFHDLSEAQRWLASAPQNGTPVSRA